MDGLKFRLKVQFAIFIAVMIFSITGIMYFENKSFFEALYFAIVTVSTVGYGDIYPVTTFGKYISIIMIVIGVGTFLGVIATFTEIILSKREHEIREQKLHILMGLFFSEIGNKLLVLFISSDSKKESMRSLINLSETDTDKEFNQIGLKLQKFTYLINSENADFVYLRNFLSDKKDLMVRLLENPYLIDNEKFTELIRSLFHLFEELQYRMNAEHMEVEDKDHVAININRVYEVLVYQWLDYMRYIKGSYPYLYKYAVKMNPFNADCKLVVEIETELFS